ncbi:MAG: hypothetical protein GC161_05600 [Planctomycetaceae bacterium]|nr:hypothetical protein [Planctomycetaceae bacterium]
MKNTTHGLLGLATTVALGSLAQAQITISEIFYNPPSTDGTQEYFELAGPAGASLDGLTFLVIEGDTTGAGVVDQVLSLDGQTIGTNGIFLWRDDALVLLPDPTASGASIFVQDFTPDIENGVNTFALISGTPPALGTDLDADNDGVLDAPVGFTVLDAIAVFDNTGADFVYNDQLGFPDGIVPRTTGPVPASHSPSGVYRFQDPDGNAFTWGSGVILGPAFVGPFAYDIAGDRALGFNEIGVATQDLDGGFPNVVTASLGTIGAGFSIATGGTQELRLAAGAARAGDLYLLVGSLSGTTPGLPVDSFVLPLNFDFYSNLTLTTPNSGFLPGSLGFLDANGRASAAFTLPAAAPVAGPLDIHHAFLTIDLSTFAVSFTSNAALVRLVP